MGESKKFYRAAEAVLGLRIGEEEHRGPMRLLQLRAVASVAGPLAAGNAILALIVFVFASNHDLTAIAWLTAAIGTVVTVYVQWLRRWRRVRPKTSSGPPRAGVLNGIWHRAAIQGVIWGIAPILFIPGADAMQQMVVYLATACVVSAAGLLLSAFPLAAFVFVVPLVAGAIGGAFFLQSDVATLPVILTFMTGMSLLPVVCRHNFLTLRTIVRSQAEARANGEAAHDLLKSTDTNNASFVWESDEDGIARTPRNEFAALCGAKGCWEPEISIGDLFARLGFPTTEKEHLEQLISAGASFRDLEIVTDIDGRSRSWFISGEPARSEAGIEYKGTLSKQVSEPVRHVLATPEELENLVNRDDLTDLLNRRSFTQAISKAVAKLEKNGTGFTLLCMDLDRFKLVNDTYGHPAGDAILREAARRIRKCVRKSDSVARLGGDEFSILLEDEIDPGYVARLSSRLLEAIGEPYEFEDQTHTIGVSIGIALAPLNGTQAEQLMRNADLALFRSKEDGRGAFRFFEFQMDRERRERRMLERDLERAVENDEFEVMFQPIVDAGNKRMLVMEALIRWDHPIRGRISPAEFIPVAEQSACIENIGRFTLMKACREAARWDTDCKVAVNISTRHFQSTALIADVEHALAETGLAPHRLEIEVTESVLAEESDAALNVLQQLRDMGVGVSLDDFGTGYSSLSYILKYPFDKLKVDRAFVTNVLEDKAARAILKMIIDLGKSLKTTITAEGVETIEQYEYLRKLGCDQIQGYYFSKPQSADTVCDMLAAEARDESPFADRAMAKSA